MQGNIILNSHRTAARPAAGKRRVKENGKEGSAAEEERLKRDIFWKRTGRAKSET